MTLKTGVMAAEKNLYIKEVNRYLKCIDLDIYQYY